MQRSLHKTNTHPHAVMAVPGSSPAAAMTLWYDQDKPASFQKPYSPSINSKFCTAAREAPLPRLSSRAVSTA